MSIAYATDADIEQMILTCPTALVMRARLYTARFEARYELERQKAAEAATYAQCARIEDEVTDAGLNESNREGIVIDRDLKAVLASLIA